MKKNILKEIIYNKFEWLKKYKKQYSLEIIKKNIKNSNRNFYEKIKTTRPCFILEAKKKSPSKGIINKHFDIIKIAKYYKKHATIISVLTEEKYFQGSFQFLQIMHTLVKQPILCKDFFIDPYQIYLARYYNADAILLMLSVLNDNEYKILSDIAHNLNMGVLTEINNTSELNRAIQLQAQVIGINNRNLEDLSINMNKTYQLAPLIPKEKTIISESGIYNNQQIKKLKKIVHGFLIGSSIMQSKNIAIKINSIIFGENKVCGLRKIQDAQKIKKFGAVYGGLIFVPKSIRYITIQIAENIISDTFLKYVGVFQNEKIENILSIINQLPLHAIQLHGNEDQEYINNLKKKIHKKIKIWKALYINEERNNIHFQNIDYYLFDNKTGGSGKCFDWSKIPKYNLNKCFLSGGLSIQNYHKAEKLNCYGLDFNSKLETHKGVKDYKKIKELFKKIRA
ncbi:bifunctional indole-3-glycerol-phosphate synthase TrpC/phosphoribosylanthranilate isomerase TrpF [Buchnera aphidicola]|uniref:bifunctional indole-3-glycerol-phosphate synthase TrpC/phosphoribosylanthranilate isomerase TrpF n=1 Tax=Buchnera aphidicola TaxID=9 RepID=UPI00346392D7